MPRCDPCNRSFKNWDALDQHKQDSSAHFFCRSCDRDFTTDVGLQQHWIHNSRHSYCKWCEEHFGDNDELEDHYEDEHHWCKWCKLHFDDDDELKDHYNDEHPRCKWCKLHFDDDIDLEEHYEEEHYFCSKCRLAFYSDEKRKRHYRSSDNHHYCSDCQRDFISENNLNHHLRSSTHRPRTVHCIGKGCTQTFISTAAMMAHIDSGACVSGIDRRGINDAMRKADKRKIVTIPSSDTVITYLATERAWNGFSYECYLCHGTYSSLLALNQHLASPRHQEKVYVCPLDTCKKKFEALSSLLQHIESEQCGIHRFKAVRNAIDDVLGRMKNLTL